MLIYFPQLSRQHALNFYNGRLRLRDLDFEKCYMAWPFVCVCVRVQCCKLNTHTVRVKWILIKSQLMNSRQVLREMHAGSLSLSASSQNLNSDQPRQERALCRLVWLWVAMHTNALWRVKETHTTTATETEQHWAAFLKLIKPSMKGIKFWLKGMWSSSHRWEW